MSQWGFMQTPGVAASLIQAFSLVPTIFKLASTLWTCQWRG